MVLLRLSALAEDDIAEILQESEIEFGADARLRYEALISAALAISPRILVGWARGLVASWAEAFAATVCLGVGSERKGHLDRSPGRVISFCTASPARQ